MTGAAIDPADVRRARIAPGLLGVFNAPGVLEAADVHVARCLAGLGGDDDETVALGAALAVRAPRLGHVCVDVATARETTIADGDSVDVRGLPWPAPPDWLARLAASPVVACGPDGPADRPLRLVGTRLYLDRYWRQECLVADDLLRRSRATVAPVDLTVLGAGLDRLFAAPDDHDGPDLGRLAVAVAVQRRLAVIAGGPGTGKTTTVARLVALLAEQAAAAEMPAPRVALAAPTGKAAARLQQAVHDAAPTLDVDAATRSLLLGLGASTLHRLLGWRPGSHSRFRHHGGNRLPHDVVVVDETSMVSLSLMAKLLDAVRPDARLVFVGDPEQLASVEAGAVLGDIVGPEGRMRMERGWRRHLRAVVGTDVPADDPPPGATIGDGTVILHRVHRYGGTIATLASAIQAGHDDDAMAVLRAASDEVGWIELDPGDDDAGAGPGVALDGLRRAVVDVGRPLVDAARRGDARAALDRSAELRVLCAHRRGPHGVERWTERIERWLAGAIDGYGGDGPWYVARPVLVTENDYELGLYNGDTGVVVAGADGSRVAAFDRRGQLARFAPTRLRVVETVHAMTVHKSQGSQYDTVGLVLPEPTSAILTRQLLYTGVTRARRRVTVVGSEASVRAAVRRPVARASGLGEVLWGPAPTALLPAHPLP